jgi:hypothetical protein
MAVMVPSCYCLDEEQSRGGRSRRRHDNINCARLRIGFDLIRGHEDNSATGMAAPKPSASARLAYNNVGLHRSLSRA